MNFGKHPNQSELKRTVDDLFRRYDTDNSGTLEWNEVNLLLTDTFKIVGSRAVTSHDIKSFSEIVDINGDGKISKAQLFSIFRILAQKAALAR